jgi:hypothetical protein
MDPIFDSGFLMFGLINDAVNQTNRRSTIRQIDDFDQLELYTEISHFQSLYTSLF